MDRIISTYVENTWSNCCTSSYEQDHLHIRGEHFITQYRWFWSPGSSPHTWRTHKFIPKFYVSHRIISTYVENTYRLVQLTEECRDHLHIRGEHPFNCKVNSHILGSSPHTWRTPVNSLIFFVSVRIISTYVENTVPCMLIKSIIQDHLHIRGEHRQDLNIDKNRKGSSPHTWRTH